MNPRLLIYTVGIILILFIVANIFKSSRRKKSGDVKKGFNGKDKDNIEDATFREEK